MILAASIALILAAAWGFLAQRVVARRHAVGDNRAAVEGLPTSDLVVPVRTIAGLLLAFVLLSVFNSFQAAGDRAAAEAGSVLAMGRAAELLPAPARADMLGYLQCYARSVVGPDWEAQKDNGQLSPITDRASDAITASLARAAGDRANDVAVNAISRSDADRVQDRIIRANEGRPSVPDEVWLVLVISVMITIGGLSALGHPDIRRGVQLAVLIGTTVVFGLTLLVIHDLDRPYSGLAEVTPAAMQSVADHLRALPGGNVELPCSTDGQLRG